MKKSFKSRTSILLSLILSISFMFASFTIQTTAQESLDSSIESESILSGKTALFCGDSICAASVYDKTTLSKTGWAGRIAYYYGMTSTNKGKDGASVSTKRVGNRILDQITAMKNNTYNYVILHGGVNDAMDSAIVGKKVESFDVSDFNTDTFAGGLEELFYYAKEYFGDDTQFGYIINFKTPKSGWGGATRNMTRYVEVAIEICDKWDIPYLDLYNDDNFNNNLMKVDTSENLNEVNGYGGIDLLHPNTAGYEVLYKVVGDWMETLGIEEVNVISEVSELSSIATSTVSESDNSNLEKALPWISGGVSVTFILVAIAYALISKKKKTKE